MKPSLNDFDYDLPEALIAQSPLPDRTASRLLVVGEQALVDSEIRALPSLLRAGDLLVFNDTRVLHARLYGVKDSGGRVEVLIERPLGGNRALAQIRASKSPKPGSRLRLEDAFDVEVLGREDEFFRLQFPLESDLFELLERHGRLPLPPYIRRDAAADDEARYQTVYARSTGSVAAPTAGLHFDEALLDGLTAAGARFAFVTLHVGAGTFQPVRVDDLSQHRMHREHYRIPAATAAAVAETRSAGGRIIAVGTTSLRALESAALDAGLEPLPHGDSRIPAMEAETELFILPGFRFRVADCLLTNFHLPKSTLLMLVSAFAGDDTIRRAYAHAVARRYRFFSYGDAMFLTRHDA